MSDILKQVYNACDPYKPATAEFYHDCAEARGSSALTQEFQRQLSLANGYLCFLFSGHIGCGKSSELGALRRALAHPQPAPSQSRMSFVQNACAYTDDVPIPLSAAHQAVQQLVRSYSTSIPEGHWEKLARLDVSADQMIPGGDGDYLAMLENVSVLEYSDGGSETDPFVDSEPWYVVNPIVPELQRFKAARNLPRQVSTP